jgi:hypothetical protein
VDVDPPHHLPEDVGSLRPPRPLVVGERPEQVGPNLVDYRVGVAPPVGVAYQPTNTMLWGPSSLWATISAPAARAEPAVASWKRRISLAAFASLASEGE